MPTGELTGGARTGEDGTPDAGVHERFEMGVVSVESSLDPTSRERSGGPELDIEKDRDVERLGRSWYRPELRGLFPAAGSLPSMVPREGWFDGNGCDEDTL